MNPKDPQAELREKLAAIEHERWADWQKWCHKILRANIKHDIEPTLARWEKQIATPYSKLSRPEQLSDLEQVDRYWPLIEEYIQAHQQELLSELLAELPEKLDELPHNNNPMWDNNKGFNQAISQVVSVIKSKIEELNG